MSPSRKDDEMFEVSGALSRLVQSLIGEVRDNSVALATFSSELRAVRDNVNDLNKIVKDGGKHEPLVTKIALIEQSLEEIEGVTLRTLEQQVGGIKKTVDELAAWKDDKSEDRKDKREHRSQRLQFWGTIIAGIIGIAATAIGLLK